MTLIYADASMDASSEAVRRTHAENEQRVEKATKLKTKHKNKDSARAVRDEPPAIDDAAVRASTHLGEELVGHVVDVYWKLDNKWYTARVVKYKPNNGKHQLHYIDDGVKETVKMGSQLWRECTDPKYVGKKEREDAAAQTPAAEVAESASAASRAGAVASSGQKRKRSRAPVIEPTKEVLQELVLTTEAEAADDESGTEAAGRAVVSASSSPFLNGCDATSAAAVVGSATGGVTVAKAYEEDDTGCARTLGSDLVERYRRQRRENLHLRRASLTTSTIMTPSYWQGALALQDAKVAALHGGSAASRAQRSQHRQLVSTLGDFGGVGTKRKKGEAGGPAMLSFNELKARKKRLIFGKSAIHSWGLYAAEPIEKEEFVTEYLGEYVRKAVADVREQHYRRAGFGDDYIFRVDNDLFVDATRRGGLARFANHCCEPNCYTRIIVAGGKQRIVLYSKKRIELGEEITYDYKFDYEEDRSEALQCMCGARKCAGFLN